MANTNITIVDASSILIGARDPDTGVVGELRDIGMSTAFKAALAADTKQLKSAKGDLIQSIQLTPTATVSIDLRDITKDNLALGLGGELIPVTEATGKTKSIASATGRNRLITSAVQGYQTGLGLEPGSTVTATVQYAPVANYTPGSGSLKSLPTTYTATSGSFAITDAIPAGVLVMQCTLKVVSPSRGTAFYTFAWQRPAS